MRIKQLSIIIFTAVSGFFQAQERPKLVVGIIVDQMRMEYLNRFRPYFVKDGFNRFLNEGFVYANMHFNYVPTYTAPGHASVYTGSTPSRHGIIGNEWYRRAEGKEVYCVGDDSVQPLGNPEKDKEGMMSPRNLLATTVTDELRLSTNFRGKVFGVSMKDRGAILPAGHFANRAYWISNNLNFISSTFYGDDFPKWVVDFNQSKKYQKYINKGWNLLRDKSVYKESLSDDNPYESQMFATKEHPVFPYNIKTEVEKTGLKALKSTPFCNDLIIEFTEELISREKLGTDDDTDFLAVSFSSPDYISHAMGPRSIEVQDTYLRLDETLAGFFKYLDSKVGKGNYLVFLTADHSGSENAKFLEDRGYQVSSVDYKETKKQLKDFSVKTFGKDYILDYNNQEVYLDLDALKTDGKNRQEIIAIFCDFIETFPSIERTYTQNEILNASPTDEYGSMIFRGYDKKQSGEIYIMMKPAFMEYQTTGATHGTNYAYDTHVPGLFYGWKIPRGTSKEKVFITEIAPTVAQKINITLPNATYGEVLKEVVD
ncbi:MAG: alkaline phosphatase family protein [Flavobacteriaceae bacterium]|jgi:predicted AlkP superfamily pyrophosphatase or phosphodiesterase|nr:alkaline phosphatase family protein [Flavobacteriaceae bacterium]